MKITHTMKHTPQGKREPVAFKHASGEIYVVGEKGSGGGSFNTDGTFEPFSCQRIFFSDKGSYTPIYPGEFVEFIKTVTF